MPEKETKDERKSESKDDTTSEIPKRELTCVLCLRKEHSAFKGGEDKYLCFRCRHEKGDDVAVKILRRRIYNMNKSRV